MRAWIIAISLAALPPSHAVAQAGAGAEYGMQERNRLQEVERRLDRTLEEEETIMRYTDPALEALGSGGSKDAAERGLEDAARGGLRYFDADTAYKALEDAEDQYKAMRRKDLIIEGYDRKRP